MNSYICVTYAHDDRKESDLFCRGLHRYGFRYSCINELSGHDRRRQILAQSSLLIALSSPAAARVETVAADIRQGLERGLRVLCISLKDNELDHRFCTGTEGGAVLIPFPTEDTPDRHALALYVHRLYVRHLARLGDCFAESQCEDNIYGQLIRCAHYAHAGDYDACFELGRAYELGLGVPALEKEAARWLKRAADRGVCDAMIRMGLLYLMGKGIERNPDEAFRLFTRAAELGDIRGIYRRGLCYLEGHGVMKDPVHAVECLRKAACAQHAPSMYRLAVLHRDGIGADHNPHTALKYLYAVCCQGFTDREGARVTPPITVYRQPAYARYACISMRQLRHTRWAASESAVSDSVASADRRFGRNTIPTRDLPENRWPMTPAELYATEYNEGSELTPGQAASIYEEDWTRADAALAAYALGNLLAEGREEDGLRASPTRALVWYRYAARLGHTEALYALGDAYRRGYGTPADLRRAVELFRLASDGGSARGRFAYAVCCERGIGTAVDPREAFRLYELAAEQGYPPAQNNLGGCHEYGIGTQKNMAIAVEWYASAANAGQADGQCRLGICYELGKGVSPDMGKAIRLYELAADHGHTYALYRRALCYDRGSQHHGGAPAAELIGALGESAVHAAPLAETDSEARRTAIDHTRAAALYRRAADLGVPEAAYAFYLCHRLERGLVRDEHDEILYLQKAAEGGCLQAAFELGICCMEGGGLPKDQTAAVAHFTHAVELWRRFSEDPHLMAYLSEADNLPPDGFPPRLAAGGALYMLAYCALYGLGESGENRTPDPYEIPAPERVARAATLLREAVAIRHPASMVLLGDLYAYGLLHTEGSDVENPDTEEAYSPEQQMQVCYQNAVRTMNELTDNEEYTRGMILRDRTACAIDALMSLAEQAMDTADEALLPDRAEAARANAWRAYSECAAVGSADALVAMAECLYHGLGAAPNSEASVRLLRRASLLDGGRVAAALWLGDSLRSRWGTPTEVGEADAVYLRGLESPCKESEGGPYTLGLRRVDRKRRDIRARSEILYRLATLRAVYFSHPANRKESFLYLAEAVLMGHAVARDDLARMLAHAQSAAGESTKSPALKADRSNRKGRRARLRRRIREHGGLLSRGLRAQRIHGEWLADYYTALCPEPEPFSYAMRSTAVRSDLPDYVTAPVTDTMRANALQYLGECFFEGHGLPTDTAAAVTCYRAALDFAPKDLPNPPASVVDATYSLGWCLLHGVGTAVDHKEAVRLLNLVYKTHPGACFTLGLCHEEGLGLIKAADRVATLEKRLQAKEEERVRARL